MKGSVSEVPNNNAEHSTTTHMPPTLHVDTVLTKPPYIRPISGCPGNFALHMGDFRAYFSIQQWEELDTQVRAAMATPAQPVRQAMA